MDLSSSSCVPSFIAAFALAGTNYVDCEIGCIKKNAEAAKAFLSMDILDFLFTSVSETFSVDGNVQEFVDEVERSIIMKSRLAGIVDLLPKDYMSQFVSKLKRCSLETRAERDAATCGFVESFKSYIKNYI